MSTLRQRAEAQTAAVVGQNLAPRSPDEMARLIEELHIHQIELELQNEELRRAQEDLDAARARYFDLYDLAPVGYVTVGEAGLILEANLTAATLLGVARSALVKERLTRFIFPEDQDSYYRHRKALFESGEPQICDLRMVRPAAAGGVFWALLQAIRVAPAPGADNGPTCRIALSDISAAKRLEHERADLLAQVQAQARQISQIMDTVPQGVLLLDAAGRVLIANPTASRDLEFLAGAAVGAQLAYLGDVPLAELLAGGDQAPWREICVGQRIFQVIARPVTADAVVARHWVVVIDDVTAAHALRQQFQQQERLASVGQLAAGIAHDFNNILTVIALYTSLVAQAPGLTERERERLTTISQQTAHAARLIQQILDFSRRAVLERRPLDLALLLREQIELLQRTLPETIAVTLNCPPGEYTVLADPTRLQQVVLNLAVNARDAMPRGGTLRLALAAQETAPAPGLSAGAWVRLEVADTGTGLAPEAEAHLFEPFFTTKPPGQGAGLGLAQVYGIVKQHSGEIGVHSTAGQGVTFTIYLPGLANAAPVAAAPTAAPAAGGGETVLVVEDNPILLSAMGAVLETLGYDSIGACNGVEALEVLAERGDTIALVLSDMVMPVMGGDELLRTIRARGLTVPVAILSGYPLDGNLVELKAFGLAAWMLKPPSIDQLAQLLGEVIGHRGA